MAKRPTLSDVALAAGVSIATVNRVISGDGTVRQDTARRVADAAAEIGYHGRNLLNQHVKSTLPEVRLGFVLHKEKQSFYQSFGEIVDRAAQLYPNARIKLRLEFCHTQAPRDVAALLMDMAPHVDAIAATAVNHHAVNEAVGELRDRNVPCYTLLSDFAQGQRKSYFGMNNMKIGRGAAAALANTARKSGEIALFVGGNRWHGHELRETGFRSHFRECDNGFNVLDTLVNLETRQLTYEATLELLSRHPNLAGIYLAGGGMEGAIQALREEVKPNQIAMVVNEHTPESRAALEDGYVSLIIGTPLHRMCETLIDHMVRDATGQDVAAPGQMFFDPILYLPEFF